MNRAQGLLIGLAASIVFAAVVIAGVGCYRGTPPCDPTTVDWPRCDPTQPSWYRSARDAGVH